MRGQTHGNPRYRGRGRGYQRGGRPYYMKQNSHNQSNLNGAFQAAENHQTRNLSFETKDPATKDSRIYVGNLCKKNVMREQLFVIFSKYGTITAISHLQCRVPGDRCNYAFVQFTSREAAVKAVVCEKNHGYYGYNLDVSLAEFGNKAGTSGSTREPSAETTLPSVLTKRPSPAESTSSLAPAAKRLKTDSVGPPDILVCGTCHVVFDGIEALIQHKRKPCESVKKCNCFEENVPKVLACAICYKQFSTPWQLMLHIHSVHAIVICTNIAQGNLIQGSPELQLDQQKEGEEVMEDAVYDELVDPENDLLYEDGDDDELLNLN